MMPAQDYWGDIWIAYGTFVLAALSPGPALLSTMGAAMSQGRRSGVMIALGVVCGSFTWGVLATIGLSSLMARYAGALSVIRVLGCLYLMYLAFKAFRSAATPGDLKVHRAPSAAPGPGKDLLRGWGIHMTNPKGLFAWIAVISLGLKPGAPSWVAPAILMGTMAFALTYYTLAAVLFSAPAMVRAYGRARRWVEGFLGVFYVFAAFKLVSR